MAHIISADTQANRQISVGRVILGTLDTNTPEISSLSTAEYCEGFCLLLTDSLENTTFHLILLYSLCTVGFSRFMMVGTYT